MHLHSSLGLLLCYFLGLTASSGRGKGDNDWGRTGWLHWRPFAPSITSVAYCPQTFSWVADSKWSHGCKDYWPDRCPCGPLLTFPKWSWDAFCTALLWKARSKGRRHTFTFLVPSSLLVLSLRPGASQRHRGRRSSGRMEDQVCTQKILSVCRSWGRPAQGGLCLLDLDEGLHVLSFLNWKDWTVFYSP